MRTFKLKIPTSASAIRFLGAGLKPTADETLFLELALRGYHRLRNVETDVAELKGRRLAFKEWIPIGCAVIAG